METDKVLTAQFRRRALTRRLQEAMHDRNHALNRDDWETVQIHEEAIERIEHALEALDYGS